jgi:hypothetical protein
MTLAKMKTSIKNCPTSNMNKSQMWGFEVSHIIASFIVLASTNVILNIFSWPLIFSWAFGLVSILGLRFVSHGQKNGHLELLARFTVEPHLFLGRKIRSRSSALSTGHIQKEFSK